MHDKCTVYDFSNYAFIKATVGLLWGPHFAPVAWWTSPRASYFLSSVRMERESCWDVLPGARCTPKLLMKTSPHSSWGVKNNYLNTHLYNHIRGVTVHLNASNSSGGEGD